MKKYIFTLACMLLALLSCQKESWPEDPYVHFPIKSLVVTLDAASDEITAKPKVNADGSLNDTLALPTFKDWASATIKTLILADDGMTASIAEGDKVAFDENDSYKFTVNDGTSETQYVLWLDYPREPEPLPETDGYKWLVIKGSSGGALADGTVHDDASPMLNRTEAANTQCNTYEAYVDLTGYSGDAIGLADADKSAGYHYAEGASSSASYFEGELTEIAFAEGVLPVTGPTAAWDGVYKLNFNGADNTFSALKTVWTVNGTATGNTPQYLTWDSENKVFTLTMELTAGIFRFVTEPVDPSDPRVVYGQGAGLNGLSTSGESIQVASDGEYTITLDLMSTPYKYTLEKVGGDEPGPAGAYMWVTVYNTEPSPAVPRIYDADGDGVYEGHFSLKGIGRGPGNPILLLNEALTNYYSADAQNLATVPVGGYAQMQFAEGVYPGYIDGNGAYCPWGDWWAGNAVWFVRYDSSDMTCFIMQTDWYVNGTATGDSPVAMTWSESEKTWSITGEFEAGDFRFETQVAEGVEGAPDGEIDGNTGRPLSETEQIIYGMQSDGVLAEDGNVISIPAAGTYTITLDLNDPSAYTYTVSDGEGGGDEPGPGPDADYVYVVYKGSGGPLANGGMVVADSPKLYETSSGSGVYSGDVDMTGYAWCNVGIVTSDLSRGFDHEHAAALDPNTFTITMTEKPVTGGTLNTGGPWGDWNGAYSMTFNINTLELTVTKK